MSCNNSAAADGFHQLAELKPAEEKDREEQSSSSGEGAFGAERFAVEERANYEGYADDTARKNSLIMEIQMISRASRFNRQGS